MAEEKDQPLSERPTVVDQTALVSEVRDTEIQRGHLTINQFMSERNIEGGISIGENAEAEASSLLASNKPQQYTIGRLLAKGGMGLILNAKDLNCRREVAMKIIGDSQGANQDKILRFIIEAQITAQLQHPGIVPVYELSVDANNDVYYTMKLVQGHTLLEIIEGVKSGDKTFTEQYSLMKLLTIFQKVCDAVAYAHSKKVIHRDLKSENVMIGDFGEVLLMDWGLAKVLNLEKNPLEPEETDQNGDSAEMDGIDSLLSDASTTGDYKTMDGQIMGTPGFMPPEQALGKSDEVNTRSDVYALGGILYHIITLQPTVTGYNIKKIIQQIVAGDIKPPVEFNEDGKSFPHCSDGKIPEAVSAVAMKALQASPDDRYQSVEELRNDVEKYMGGFLTSVEERTLFSMLLLMVKRHKKEVIQAGLVLLIIISMIVGFMVKIIEAKNEAQDNLQKFYHERTARQVVSKRLLVNAMQDVIAANPKQRELSYQHKLTENKFSLDLQSNRQLSEIGALKGIPLIQLNLSDTAVADISALNEMPLSWLSLAGTKVMDLTPLKEMKLIYLDISNSAVIDIAPLEGMGLRTLNIAGIPSSDLSILKSLPLTRLSVDAKQLDYVVTLKDLKLKELSITNADMSQVYLLKDMNTLELLELSGRKVSNLELLTPLGITKLSLVSTKVRDFSPLQEMTLTSLRISHSLIKDVSVFEGIALKELRLEKCYYLRDLLPLVKFTTLERLLIPPHVTEIEHLRTLPQLKVLANNTSDFERNQSPAEFWAKIDSEQ
jgi:serine/threonine protein kinase